MGLNTSLIEDTKARRRAGQLTHHQDTSDVKSLTSPNFAVIQALVMLLAQNGACFAALNRAAVSSPAHKCKSVLHFYFIILFPYYVNIGLH